MATQAGGTDPAVGGMLAAIAEFRRHQFGEITA
jgi:hypothetical protein